MAGQVSAQKGKSPARESEPLRHAESRNNCRFSRRGTFTAWFPGTATRRSGGRTMMSSRQGRQIRPQPFARRAGLTRVPDLEFLGELGRVGSQAETVFISFA